MEASHTARLTQRGRKEDIEVVDVPVTERAELLRTYADRYGKMPTVASVLRALPDPGDHPVFRITTSRATSASAGADLESLHPVGQGPGRRIIVDEI